jgi:hypothetical protein
MAIAVPSGMMALQYARRLAMGWVKITLIVVIVAAAALGTVIGVQQYQATKRAAAAKALAHQNARVAAARSLLANSQNAKANPRQRAALKTLHLAGAQVKNCVSAASMGAASAGASAAYPLPKLI